MDYKKATIELEKARKSAHLTHMIGVISFNCKILKTGHLSPVDYMIRMASMSLTLMSEIKLIKGGR
jgi:hypothetical protein